jgi:hypothetical protein
MKKLVLMLLVVGMLVAPVYADLASKMQVLGYLAQAKSSLKSDGLDWAGYYLRHAGELIDQLTPAELKEVEAAYNSLQEQLLKAIMEE